MTPPQRHGLAAILVVLLAAPAAQGAFTFLDFSGNTNQTVTTNGQGFTSNFTAAFTGTSEAAYIGTVAGTYTYVDDAADLDNTGGVRYYANSLQPTFTLNNTAGSYATLTFDFRGLANGYLPAGASFFFEDWDGNNFQTVFSDITNWTATGSGGTALGGQWLTVGSLADTRSSTDFSDGTGYNQSGIFNGGANDPGPDDYPTLSSVENSGVTTYSLLASRNGESARPTIEILTTENIETISMQVILSNGYQNFIQIADNPVITIPEPGSLPMALGGIASLVLIRRRRRVS